MALTERQQQQIDRLLDDAEGAFEAGEWVRVHELCDRVLRLDPDNEDARAYIDAASRDSGMPSTAPPPSTPRDPSVEQPTSFAGGRYEVRRFLGEGGKKRVFLAHDTRLDRDVAFALIKTEGLDAPGRERITREAQAMGRLGAHPHIVTIFDIGEEDGSPYVVNELLAGGDVEGELQLAAGPLPLARTLEIAKGVARGLVFAHERGIVHRDLKPGNVWLTEDGTAKIGDFGLAVSLDRSRLTQHGMMVGTVAYMPPEQALGGEVTPQADLYSLGAMLYELVTGRPPFQADDPTAIISQHINTPPVAPSWHSEHCPPDLEALVLRLLAKVPADRPASATEVLAALEAVDPEARSASRSDLSANPLDRLARGVFVGRERELERLRGAFDEAFAGHGSVVMLVGEPGVGKTRMVQELETYARMRGGKVLWGRSHESEGAPAYWPWLQVGNAYGASVSRETLIERLSNNAEQLQVLFPQIRNFIPHLPEPTTQPTEAAQFLLFAAYTEFFVRTSGDEPLVLVLDDLHWADKPTLQLLQHVCGELASSRLLVVGTYRDTELARTHPLSETLASMNRAEAFTRVNLRGLTRSEVERYLRETAGVELNPHLAARVFEETEGNAFFLHEVVKLLMEEDRLHADSVSDIEVPEGVREALGRRLDRLSPEANELLRWAAVIGREFTYDTVQLLDLDLDADLLAELEEGLRAHVINEMDEPGRFQFTHALMQETLLDELSTTRRVQMHGQVAETLERRYGDQADERATRLAFHFGESATLNPGHAQKAVRYARLAGSQAFRLAAWSEAEAHFDRALNLADVVGVEPVEVAQLHLASARAARLQTAVGPGRGSPSQRAQVGLDLLRASGEWGVLADALPEFLGAWLFSRDRAYETSLVDDVLAHLGNRDLHLRALILARSGRNEADEHARQSVDEAAKLAASHGFEDVKAVVAGAMNIQAMVEGRFDDVVRHASDAFDRYLSLGQMEDAGLALIAIANAHWASGRIADWAEAADSCTAFALSNHWARWSGEGYWPAIHSFRGDFMKARTSYEDQISRFGRGFLLWPGTECILFGTTDEALRRVQSDLTTPTGAQGSTTLLLHECGRSDEASQAFARFMELLAAEVAYQVPFAWRTVGEAAAALGDDALVLEIVDAHGHWESDVNLRTRARCSLRLGRLDEAHERFTRALEWAMAEHGPLEEGLARRGLADVAEMRGDHALATLHLDTAGELFSRHGAKLYLDQVLAKKEILKA